MKMMNIESLPIIIFQLIQKYIDEQSYQYFMNCNQNTFQCIKYETIQYHLSISMVDEEKMKRFVILSKKVKDKSKQIKFHGMDATRSLLIQYSPLFAGIQEIHITADENEEFDSFFNFSVFENIETVILSDFKTIRRITFPIHGIKRLTLENFKNLEEIVSFHGGQRNDYNGRRLEEIRITYCEILRRIPDLYDMKVIEFEEVPLENLNLENCSKSLTSFTSRECPLYMNWFENPQNLHLLTKLILEGVFPNDFDQFSLFTSIPFLTLKRERTLAAYPLFPEFTGKYLSLRGFNLSLWHEEYEFLGKALALEHCTNVSFLPHCPNASTVFLDFIADLTAIPTFPVCRLLIILHLPQLTAIQSQPKISRLTISFCSRIRDLFAFENQVIDEVKLWHCEQLYNISSLRKVRNLQIEKSLNSSFSFEEFSDPDFLPLKRCLTLSGIGLGEPFNLAFLYSLTLKEVQIISCAGLHDIYHLTIVQCELYSTKGLKNIYKLEISQCFGLKSLDDLIGIKIVKLYHLPNIQTFYRGLGNHEQLTVHDVPKLEQEMKKFFESKRMSKIQKQMWESIRFIE